MERIIVNINQRCKIVICGGGGSGKTTLLNDIRARIRCAAFDDGEPLGERIMDNRNEIAIFTCFSSQEIRPHIRQNVDLWIFTTDHELNRFIDARANYVGQEARQQARNLMELPHRYICYNKQFDTFFN